mmetsp:Transcript_18378/g.45890  ORF Transcript_18378/g.45890 Transcript_18378/m.45890 type:complete len:260 (+) Transcript_18378:1550-2329(+)
MLLSSASSFGASGPAVPPPFPLSSSPPVPSPGSSFLSPPPFGFPLASFPLLSPAPPSSSLSSSTPSSPPSTSPSPPPAAAAGLPALPPPLEPAPAPAAASPPFAFPSAPSPPPFASPPFPPSPPPLLPSSAGADAPTCWCCLVPSETETASRRSPCLSASPSASCRNAASGVNSTASSSAGRWCFSRFFCLFSSSAALFLVDEAGSFIFGAPAPASFGTAWRFSSSAKLICWLGCLRWPRRRVVCGSRRSIFGCDEVVL